MKIILREDVEKLGKAGEVVKVKDGFGRQIDQRRFFGVLAWVKGGTAGGGGTARRTRSEKSAGLPVEKANLRVVGVRLDDQDTLGAQGTVDDAVTVRVADRVGNLPGQIEPNVERQCRSPLAEEMVEPNLVGFPAEQDCWAEFVFLKVERVENAGVIEALQNPEFLEGASADGLASRCVAARHRVQPRAANGMGGGMLGVEVLVGKERILFDQVLKDVVSHATLSL